MSSVTGGSSGDCEGEDQDDSSSSNLVNVEEAAANLEKLTVNDQEKEHQEQDVLSAFREQWQRELVSTPSPQRELPHNVTQQECRIEELVDDEEKAKQLFLRGVELERQGKLYEAVQHYRRAVILQPDIERKLYNTMDSSPADTQEVEEEEEPATRAEPSDSDEEEDEGGDLLAKFHRILDRKGTLFEMEFPQKTRHISSLPYEVLLVVLRWVAGCELDAVSLSRCAAVCRGLYCAVAEQDLWRDMCLRTWGIDCATPKAHGYADWRHMYKDRPRLNFNGCYISKTSYLRHGENSFQDTFYRPWYLIDYYRYLRFFPDGLALMLTSSEEPSSVVGGLRARTRHPALLAGHYRLVGDKVVVILKKQSSEKKPQQPSNTRFRARRKEPQETHEQIYHLDLELHSSRSRRNSVLWWRGYAVCRRDQWTPFDISPNKFPNFSFSVVRAYTADVEAPLA